MQHRAIKNGTSVMVQLEPAARGTVTVSVAQAVHGLPKPDQRVNAVATPATTAAVAAVVPFAHPGVFISASQLDTIRSAVKAKRGPMYTAYTKALASKFSNKVRKTPIRPRSWANFSFV